MFSQKGTAVYSCMRQSFMTIGVLLFQEVFYGRTGAGKTEKYFSTGLLAHVDAGKTTLSEALLYLTGAIRKMGRVDDRDAFLDTYELERERGITIFFQNRPYLTLGIPM